MHIILFPEIEYIQVVKNTPSPSELRLMQDIVNDNRYNRLQKMLKVKDFCKAQDLKPQPSTVFEIRQDEIFVNNHKFITRR